VFFPYRLRSVDFDLDLASGRLRARSWGPDDAPLLLCGHGLSASLLGFSWLAPKLAGPDRRVVAVDFRGRGASEITPEGTYGPHAHARDVLDAATALGAAQFDYAGWSMGALIALAVAVTDGARLRSVTLIDHAGSSDPASIDLIRAGLARLDTVVPTPEDYLAALRTLVPVEPWSDFWDDYYRYELGQRDDGKWSARTSRAACTEDLETLLGFDAAACWPSLTMPTALVRALRPIGGGLIVPDEQRDAIVAAVPQLALHELDANHYTVMTHSGTLEAMRALL
jgi:pimeloyl-ACP methyl ester carboxylesterase